MDDLAYESARSISAAIRDGRLKSRDHLEAMLDRIERLNGPLNAVVTLDAERARREADAADAALSRGVKLGPLHGVCMTIKDSFETQGMRTTSGAPELSDYVAETDAVPVARLREAGAVIVGKTNLPIYAGDAQSYNEVFGQTNNPWNVERTPGGSSGGAAAALAAGFTPLELGSDIGGSIRGPAHTCGVTGHKPSFGIVPALGQIPGPPGTLTQADLAVAGPMARDVDDLELALDVLAGPDDWHRVGYRLELPPPRHTELRNYRIAVWLDEPSCPLDASVRALLGEAAKSLESAGARVVPWDMDQECCGFGGLFSVKAPEVSVAMADRKLDTLPDVDTVVSADGGCLLQLDGRARRRRKPVRFRSLSSVLWEARRGGA